MFADKTSLSAGKAYLARVHEQRGDFDSFNVETAFGNHFEHTGCDGKQHIHLRLVVHYRQLNGFVQMRC